MSSEWMFHFLRTYFTTDQYSPIIERDLRDVLSNFPDLNFQVEPKVDYSVSPRRYLQLYGTIPVYCNGQVYHTPIVFRISDKYPNEAPQVYLKPTYWMYIRPSKNVDPDGNVSTYALNYWRQSPMPLKSLKWLVFELISVFGQHPPLGSLTKLDRLDGRGEYIAKLQIEQCFVDPVRTKQDAIEVVEAYADITVKFKKLLISGITQDVLTLEDTLPDNPTVEYSIHVTGQYPQQAPVVIASVSFIERVNGRSKYVGKTRPVKTQYLKDWRPNCNLLGLVQDFRALRGEPLPTNVIPVDASNIFQELSDSVSSVVFSQNGSVPGKRRADDNASTIDAEQVSGRRAPENIDEHSLGSTEYFDTHCDLCNKKNGGFVEAEGSCRTCKAYLCKYCSGSICGNGNKRHLVLSRDKMPKPNRPQTSK